MHQEYTSKNTSVNTVSAIYKKISFLPGDTILDYGGGKYDKNIEYMKNRGATVKIFDPYNRSLEYNEETIKYFLENPAKIVVCSNVLCVIKEEEIIFDILKKIKALMSKDGILYITIYEKDNSGVGKESKKDCWQNNKRTKEYTNYVTEIFSNCEYKNKCLIARNNDSNEPILISQKDDKGNIYWAAKDNNIKSVVGSGSTKEEAVLELKENLLFYLTTNE